MKNCYRNLIMAMMFLVILFASVSFATQEEADEIFREILDNMKVGTIEFSNVELSENITVPTIAISVEDVNEILPEGWSLKNDYGSLKLTYGDTSYTKTILIENKAGYSMPPDTALDEWEIDTVTVGMDALTSGTLNNRVAENLYGNEDTDVIFFTYGGFESWQKSSDIPMESQASVTNSGQYATFLYGDSTSYDNNNFISSSEDSSIQVTTNGNGGTQKISNTSNDENSNDNMGVLTEIPNVDLEVGNKMSFSGEAVDDKIPFNVSQDGYYYIECLDKNSLPVKIENMVLKANGDAITTYTASGSSFVGCQLTANTQYYVWINSDYKDNGPYQVNIERANIGATDDTSMLLMKIEEDKGETTTLFEAIEELVSKLVMALSKTLNFLLCDALNETITLDDVIFNSYSETKIDFFERDVDGSKITTNSSLIPLLRTAVNDWYKAFKSIALVGYMILLLYLGIKLMWASTLPDAKAKMKQTFTTWCVGLMMLMFFPYVMKYIILLNNGIVDYISGYCMDHDNAKIDPSAEEGLIYTDYDNVIDFSTGDDYMTKVGALGESEHKLGYALTYAILSWQLIMLVIYYYKRLFITAFLIIIFPIIALMYVWDKLNDGRSQSLSIWLREFTMCVFVQTFHAIVYVFIVNVIYSTLDENSYDFIILMIASSFLFAGENILKSIFGGGGEALGSASQTARKVTTIATVTTRVGSRVIKNIVSKDGYLRKTISSVGQARKFGYLYGKDPTTGQRRINMIATNEAAQARINKMLSTGGPVSPTIREAAEVVDTFNNADKMKPEQLADAMSKYNRLMQKRKDGSMTPDERKQFDAIMKQSKVSMNQMDRFNKAMTNAATAYSLAGDSKDAKKTIMQNLQVEVEVVFNGANPNELWTTDKKKIKQYKYDNAPSRVVDRSKISKNTNNMIQAGFMSMPKTTTRGLGRKDVQDAARQKVQDANRVYSNVKFQTSAGSGSANALPDRNARAQAIANQYKNQLGRENIDVITEIHIDIYAKKLAIAQEVGVQEINVNDAYEVASSVPTGKASREMFDQMARLANLQADIDTLKYALSKKAMTDASVTAGMQQRFAKIAETMEQQARSATTDIPAYTAEASIDFGRNDVAIDPYISILDILQASESNGGNVNDFNDMIYAASTSGAIEQIVDSKMDEIRSGNQSRIMDSQDMPEYALKFIKSEVKDYEYEEATYNGYTEKEVKELKRAAIAEVATNSISMLADVATLPVGGMVGMAFGAANTTDGMPFAEMAAGFSGGMEVASQLGEKIIPGAASAATRRKTQTKFAEKAKARLEDDEQIRLEARTAFEDAQYANRGKADTYLRLDGFTANLIVDANNDLTAIINVRAENAEYVSVNEQPGANAWQAFQENISYTFRDNDYRKTHSLYVYVRDASGNIKNSVQYNLKV